MKKLFLLAAAALTVFAACTKNEVVPTPDQKITFSYPVVGNATKASDSAVPGEINANEKYPKGENFSVFALHHKDAYTTWGAGTIYMNDVDCAYSNTDDSWLPEFGDGGLAYYWPKDPNSKLTFAAYSPTAIAEDSDNISYGATGLEIENFKIPKLDGNQYDFMYSERTYNKTDNLSKATDPSYNGVDINFKHALSQIAFTVATDEDYSANMTVNLLGIQVNGLICEGTFNETVTDGASYTAAPAWSLDTDKYNHTVTFKTNPTLVTDEKSEYVNGNNVFVIPQPVSGLQVIVSYNIKNGDLAEPIQQTATLDITSTGDTDNASTAVNEATSWVMGKKYVYNIIIGFKKIMFSPEVVDWDVVDDAKMKI